MERTSLLARTRAKVALLAGGAGLLGLALVPGATPASAETGDLVCPEMHAKFTFDPPLSASNPETNVIVDVNAGPTPCYSLNGNFGPDAKYNLNTTWHGHQDQGTTATLSPTGGPGICGLTFVVEIGEPGFPYHWDDRDPKKYPPSILMARLSTDLTDDSGLAAHLAIDGHIVRGPMAGNDVQAVLPVASVNPDCATNGLRELKFDPITVFYG